MVLHYRSIEIVVSSIVWYYKCLEIYVYCAVLIMVAANANSGRPTINYSRLLDEGGFARTSSKETTQCKHVISNQSATTTP